jgi:hypothetical protein
MLKPRLGFIVVAGVAAGLLLFAAAQAPASAAKESAAIAQGFSAGNNEASKMVSGALASTAKGSPDKIELATLSNASRLVGIVNSAPLLTISDGNTEVQVVISGKSEALVSDINGSVKAGDRISASPLSGVGMRATVDSQIVGVAQTDQPADSSNTTTTRKIKDAKGVDHTIHVGTVSLQVGTSYYQAPGSNFLPPVVQRIANSIAGRSVSFFRILLSGIVLITTLSAIFILLHTSTKASIMSIGRNPLAANAIRGSLRNVIIVSVIVLAFGVTASYSLLRF